MSPGGVLLHIPAWGEGGGLLSILSPGEHIYKQNHLRLHFHLLKQRVRKRERKNKTVK